MFQYVAPLLDPYSINFLLSGQQFLFSMDILVAVIYYTVFSLSEHTQLLPKEVETGAMNLFLCIFIL